MAKFPLLAAAAFGASFVVNAALAQTVVPVAPFESIELRGGGHVTLRHGAEQKVTIRTGSTQFTTFELRDSRKLVIDACHDNCPMHYDLDIEIVTPNIAAVAVSGGGAIESASGFPVQPSLAAAVNGGGRIDMRAIDVRSATAAVEGGGKIDIRASTTLTAAVDGGGSIRYVGAANVTTAINGGGSVRPEGS
jgi:hypothetical protein